MTEQVERTIDRSELRWVVIDCPKCHAEYVLDAKSKTQRERFGLNATDDRGDHPFECPFCGEPFDKNRRVVFKAFCEFLYYAGLVEDTSVMRFRLQPSRAPQSDAR